MLRFLSPLLQVVFAGLLLLPLNTLAQPHSTDDDDEAVHEDYVPENVKNSFNDLYPTALGAEWEREGRYYEVDFEVDGELLEAKFRKDGQWMQTSQEIRRAPKPVYEAFSGSEYADSRIHEVEHVKSAGITEFYVLEVDHNDRELELQYLPNGELIKTQLDDANE